MMARGGKSAISWQSAFVACLIGALLVSCHVAPYATGQALLTVEARTSLPTTISVLQRNAPDEVSTVEPADSETVDSSTSQDVYSEEYYFSSSGTSEPTESGSRETEEASVEKANDTERSRLDTTRVSGQLVATEDTLFEAPAESPSEEVSSHPEPETYAGNPAVSSTIAPTTTTGSYGPNCTERPYVDMTRSTASGGYRHRKFSEDVTDPRARRIQRTEQSARGQPHSARSGAGPQGKNANKRNDYDEVVELYAARYGYRIFRSPGDLMLTLIVETDDFGATLFAIDRINELQREAGGDTSVGLSIIHLLNTSLVQRILQQEVNYLKECSTNTIGIFVSPHLWPAVRLLSETLDYNIFPLPATYDLLFTKAAHLLYELPWTNPNSSAVVRAGSNELTVRFSAICRQEHLCLESLPSADTIYILLEPEPSISFATNGTLVLVVMGKEPPHASDLPDGAFVIAEKDLNVAALGHSWERYGMALRGMDLLAIGSLLLEVVDLVKRTGNECRNASIECMNNWKYHAKRSSVEVLIDLQLKNATQLMTFELRQKTAASPASTITSVRDRTVADGADTTDELKLIASSNVVTNYTTVYQRVASDAPSKLGAIFYCAKEFEIRHPDFIERHQRPVYYGGAGSYEDGEMYWQIKMEAWVAAGLTVSSLGILLCAAILIFLIVRVCMDDILEGHPLGSILLLVCLIVQFAAFVPFSIEYTGYTTDFTGHGRTDTMHIWNAHCTVKIFLVSMCYCMTFSLLLCRAIMLASIGSEGGFLSHINGYIQSVICGFSTLVQLGLSSQLVIVLHAHSHSISCGEIYYGHWFWAVIAYDGVLLVALIFLAPFIFRSQRNYREGLLLVTGSVLCLVIWTVWIPLCMFGYEWREAAISLGLVATALAVLVGIMIPRCFLMVRSIARSDLVQALPSLTSLAFAQANQFISDQSVYECVNPAMRQRTPTADDNFVMDQDLDEAYSANSEIPTLPLRGQRRLRQENGTITMSTSNGTLGPGNTLVPPNVANVTHIAPNFYGISNPYSCSDSLSSISPNKITRF